MLPQQDIEEMGRMDEERELVENYLYDIERYLEYSTTINQERNKHQLEARMRAEYHLIEKGLSLKDPRPGFGKEHIDRLLLLIEEYIRQRYPKKNSVLSASISVLQEYLNYHKLKNYALGEYGRKIGKYLKYGDSKTGGVFQISKKEILSFCQAGFKEFANHRYSIREYSEEPVSMEIIERAIEMAQKTPSVCNRQTCRVYVIEAEMKKTKILSCHEGNRGFGHLADKILIVTSDLNAFEGVHERNQPYIDGGMFAMSLIYGLHYEGLAACALNWCATKEQDLQLRSLIPIPASENVILLITVGHMPESFSVPKSHRKNVEEIVTVIV